MKTLTVEQSVRLLDAVKHSQIYGAVLLALVTGMRRGEILALRWRRVDLDRGTIQVVENLEQTKTGLRFKSLKNNRTRAVVLPVFVIGELRRLKRRQVERLLVIGIRQSGDALECCREDGEPKQPSKPDTWVRLLRGQGRGHPEGSIPRPAAQSRHADAGGRSPSEDRAGTAGALVHRHHDGSVQSYH
jgi:integrase